MSHDRAPITLLHSFELYVRCAQCNADITRYADLNGATLRVHACIYCAVRNAAPRKKEGTDA